MLLNAVISAFTSGRPYRAARSGVLLAIVLGCSGQTDAPEQPHTLGDSGVSEEGNGRVDWPDSIADDTVIISAADLRDAPTYRPTPDLSLGSGRGGEQDEFGVIGGVAIDGEGRIYVWDTYSYRIRVYAKDGTFIRDIGRKGTGPGEFKRPTGTSEWQPLNGIAISHDTLFALDMRLHAFDTAGAYLVSKDMELPIYNSNSITATPSGLVLVFALSRQSTKRALQMLTADFSRGVSVDSFVATQYFHEYGDPLHRPILPHAFLPYNIGVNGMFYFAVGDSFHVDVRRADGHVATSFIADVAKVPVSSFDRKDFLEAVQEDMFRLTGGSADDFERSVASDLRAWYAKRPFDGTRQAISAIIISERGDFLLERPDLTKRPYRRYDQTELSTWTLLNSRGVVKSHIELPISFLPKVFTNCTVVGVRYTEDGTELLQRFELADTGCVI
ncbi:MAG TPA: 6-bladed beta-propeller [Longimicrobiales bacterium]